MNKHRKDLSKTELDKLGDQMLPFFEKYGFKIAIGLGLTILIGVMIGFWLSNTKKKEEQLWRSYFQAKDKEKFAKDHPNTLAAHWANFDVAQEFLTSGIDTAFTNHESSQANFQNAKEQFEELLKQDLPSDLRQKALFGLAQTQEMLQQEGTDPAQQLSESLKSYQEFVATYPDTTLAMVAKQRITQLEQTHTQEFYTWFHSSFRPKPEDLETPKDGTKQELAPPRPPEIPDLLRLDSLISKSGNDETEQDSSAKAPAAPDSDSNSNNDSKKEANQEANNGLKLLPPEPLSPDENKTKPEGNSSTPK